VEAIGVGRVESVGNVGAVQVAVILGIGTPVKGAAHLVDAAGGIAGRVNWEETEKSVMGDLRGVVAAKLGDVNFARSGPDAVGVVDGKHPDCGPEPVALWHFRHDLYTSILDGGLVERSKAGGFDRVNDRAVCDVCHSDAVSPSTSAAASKKVEDVVVLDKRSVLKRGLDPKITVLDKGILVVIGGLLEISIAKAADRDLFRPDIAVKCA